MSLRARLLLAIGAVALIALAAADIATYSSLRSFLYDRVDQSLETTNATIVQAQRTDDRFGHRPIEATVSNTFVLVRYLDGTERVAADYYRDGKESQPKLPRKIDGLAANAAPGESLTFFTVGSAQAGGPQFRVSASALGGGTSLILAVPLDDAQATLGRLIRIESAVTVAALLAAMLLGWWLVRLGLRPLAAVEHTAAAIAEGDLDRRVAGESATEVGHLARAFNVMLDRIQGAFAQRDATEAELRRSEQRLRRFVADASHELRTPVAAVAAYAELFERGANVRPDDLARVMSGIRIESLRMGELVADLLLLAQLDEGRPLRRDPVELVSLAAEAVAAALTVGPEWPIRLEARTPVEVLGDRTRLRQVLDNLLTNVRAHTPAGTYVVVHVGSHGEEAFIEVTDNGPGLSSDAADRVFERFYRVDESRSRDSGGAGLGLAIVAAIVAAHGGNVSTGRTGQGSGATFTVRLPLTPSTDPPDFLEQGSTPEPAPRPGDPLEPGQPDRFNAGAA
jgi:two-component system OmpR family sensor kinase